MKNAGHWLLVAMMAAGSSALQSCDPIEALYESSFNEVLSDTWSSASRKSAMEESAEDRLTSTFEDALQDKLDEWGASLVEMSVSFDAGSSPPAMDLSNRATTSTGSATTTTFDWRVSPQWTGSGAKITITGKIKYLLVNHNFTAKLTNIALGGNGMWQIRTPDEGSSSATVSITGAVGRGDMTLEIGSVYSGSWEETSSDLGEALVRSMVIEPITEEYGW
ncbi:MAG: hypothetical protein HYY17_12565 [Planctomycetes bacterium]|nr:hypothetical protein [Planctomycetota bacterium]